MFMVFALVSLFVWVVVVVWFACLTIKGAGWNRARGLEAGNDDAPVEFD